jgi:LDH2 family malate/lactate/ureidoglycolate dehydrogenase
VLSDLRNCPPAPGFERVEIPGEREREQKGRSKGVIAVPEQTWNQLMTLYDELKG